MTAIVWDQAGERVYETGVDHGVLFLADGSGAYTNGYAWNGLTTVTESPTGAEANPQYADNIKYLNLISVEQFGATIEAFTYPPEFGECDGTASPEPGVSIGQQPRRTFGFCYRSKVGNDQNAAAGYKLHLIYNAMAAPSERAYTTVNDQPEAIGFSWDVTTTPVLVAGYQPTSSITIDSTLVDATALAALEQVLYGSVGVDPMLPTPDDVLAYFSGTITTVTPTAPTYDSGTHVITIPTVTGVEYKINSEVVTGTVTITTNTVVTANPTPGHKFPAVTDNDWLFVYS